MNVLAIDPGPLYSAFVEFDGEQVTGYGHTPNDMVFEVLDLDPHSSRRLACEFIQNMGMAAGKELFETAFWVGRFVERWMRHPRGGYKLVYRTEVKMHLCGSTKARDPNVRQALIDRYGGDSVAIGGKRCIVCKGKGWVGRGRPTCDECSGSGYETMPGPLANISGHCWQALAVAVYATDTAMLPTGGEPGR